MMQFSLSDDISLRALALLVEEERRKNHTIGLTSGCFDLIHFQHFWFFERCRRYCDILIVGVDSDEMVRQDKGPKRPFIFDFKRVVMVDALKPVSATFIMKRIGNLRDVAEIVRPDYLFRNNDFVGREDSIIGREFAKEVVIIHDVLDHQSTTAISCAIAQTLK